MNLSSMISAGQELEQLIAVVQDSDKDEKEQPQKIKKPLSQAQLDALARGRDKAAENKKRKAAEAVEALRAANARVVLPAPIRAPALSLAQFQQIPVLPRMPEALRASADPQIVDLSNEMDDYARALALSLETAQQESAKRKKIEYIHIEDSDDEFDDSIYG